MLRKITFTLALAAILTQSCTDLNEKVFSEVTSTNFYQTKEEVEAAVMRPYSHLRQIYLNFSTNGGGVYLLEELSTDEAAWPTKGRDGYDNGNWIRLHRHEWTVEDGSFYNTWNDLYKGIALCNNMLVDLEKTKAIADNQKAQYNSELRALRAYFHYYLLDLYGNVPVITSLDQFSTKNNTSEEVFNFIESEILDVRNNLIVTGNPGWYGRFTKEAANALLSRLYLNAEKYTGIPEWQKCIDVSESLIHEGAFKADDSWQTPFSTNNEVSGENIFVIPGDAVFANESQLMFQFTTHWAQRVPQFAFEGNGGFNGMVSVREFIETFDTLNDKRCFFDSRSLIAANENDTSLLRGQFMWGPQWGVDGLPVLGTNEHNGQQLNFSLDVTDMESGDEASGARNIKYKVKYGSNGFDNDIVIFRLAEIYFSLAEASLRLNGIVNPDALQGINEIRRRAGVSTYSSPDMNLNELFAEKGREMCYEGVRRTDMIRFGNYTGKRWDKAASENFRNLYPIPQISINNNSNLKQNPGYPQSSQLNNN